MDGRHNLDQIIAAVREQFAGVPEAAGDEVSVFVDDLVQRGFVGFEMEAPAI
jgi:hypothetical protein